MWSANYPLALDCRAVQAGTNNEHLSSADFLSLVSRFVWTAHNFLPHESVFKDDFLARKLLVENCDTVIALNQEICELIRDSFHPKRISLIPAAEPGLKHRPDREAVRSRLGIPNSKLHFCALGHVRPYKGPDIYLKSLLNHVSKNRFSLAGSTNDDHYESEIIELGKQLTASGIDLDLQIKFLSDLELEEYLVASDFLVCPFRQISNSGIINLALENGIPLVLPDLPSLNWVPRESAIWYQAESAELGLSNAISEAEKLTFEARESMALAGQEFMQFRGWDNYVARHIEIYQDLIQ